VIHAPVPDVCEEFETHFPAVDNDLSIPVRDTFHFADRNHCLSFSFSRHGSRASVVFIDCALKRVGNSDV
jgi:hypothetical protein